MKDTTIHKIKEIYEEALTKLKELKALQKKLATAELKRLEKEQIKKLKEELAK